MGRKSKEGVFVNVAAIGCGLTKAMLESGVEYVHDTLDTLDRQLTSKGLPRMTGLVELANLSSIIGNILASGLVTASNGVFRRAGPHKYQDLRATGKDPCAKNIEVKVALEKTNRKDTLPRRVTILFAATSWATLKGSSPWTNGKPRCPKSARVAT
jgi:hypothetical protein